MTRFIVRLMAMALIVGNGLITCADDQQTIGWRTDGTGRYPDATPPVVWSAEKNVVWKTEMPGKSFGSPIIVGQQIFVVSDPAELISVRRSDGEILWQRSNTAAEVLGAQAAEQLAAAWEKINEDRKQLQRAYSDLRKAEPEASTKIEKLKEQIDAIESEMNKMRRNNPIGGRGGSGNSAGTPVSDGKNVYSVFGNGIVSAYSTTGSPQWIKFVEGALIGFGHSASVVLVDGKLIVHLHDLVALDAATGEVLWRVELPARHASPIATRIGELDVLLSPSGSIVRVSDGKVLASEGALRLSECSPIIHDGVVYAQSGRTSALRLPRADRESIALEMLWEADASRGRRTPSPVFHQGLIYGVTTNGILDVTEAKTGRIVYRKRLDLGRNIYSSVTAAGKYIYVSSTDGQTVVLEAGPEYREVARNQLEPFGSCPVFAASRMYVRGQKHLYCIVK